MCVVYISVTATLVTAHAAEAAHASMTILLCTHAYEHIYAQESVDTTQAMDTAAKPASEAQPPSADPRKDSVIAHAPQNVIQAYKSIVKGMVGLMLKLSQEGPSPALTQELSMAANSLVWFFVELNVVEHQSIIIHFGAAIVTAKLAFLQQCVVIHISFGCNDL